MMASKNEKPVLAAHSLSLNEWLEHVLVPEHKRSVRLIDCRFPTDGHQKEFLETINDYTEETIKNLLRLFLLPSGTLGHDQMLRRWVRTMDDSEAVAMINQSEFLRRLTEPPFLPWEGITWVLDLLPHYPVKALTVLDAFFTAHCQYLPDARIHGVADAEAVIRRRYVHKENPRDALLALSPEDFEYLVAALYKKIGHDVVVTRTSRDGGVDVEARKNDAGSRALILIQCKRYEKVVRVPAVRELMGVVSRRQANKGVVIATCGFTRDAEREAESTPMIELINYAKLNHLLNANFGSNWPDRMSYHIRDMQMTVLKKQNMINAPKLQD